MLSLNVYTLFSSHFLLIGEQLLFELIQFTLPQVILNELFADFLFKDDGLTNHNNMPFSTEDADNDKRYNDNCAVIYKGAWWYNDCYHSNLNGMYPGDSRWSDSRGFIKWYQHLKHTEMKIRPYGV